MTTHIHDCSNSSERPAHRGGGGPITNDIMRYLHEHASEYECDFVEKEDDADVIITNDVFTRQALCIGTPLVKRMCAPFWRTSLEARNEPLNKAAIQADKVIFITEYSKQQYLSTVGYNLHDMCVVKHWADPKEYGLALDIGLGLQDILTDWVHNSNTFTLAACATDWSRDEKRLADLIGFAEAFPKDTRLIVIGKCDKELPKTCVKTGYLSNPRDVAAELNKADGFINLSYRDAATKVCAQAINCGLPVLFADSGGVSEMVGDCGVAINDKRCLTPEDSVPPLNYFDTVSAWAHYLDTFYQLKKRVKAFDKQKAFKDMLDGYFGVIRSIK